MPIGQVFFVPREEITMRDCTDEKVAAIKESKARFAEHKVAVTLATPYGYQYSPRYARERKSRRAGET